MEEGLVSGSQLGIEGGAEYEVLTYGVGKAGYHRPIVARCCVEYMHIDIL